MKKFLWISAAVILGIIVLSSIGPIIGLAISLLIVYFSLKQFMATDSTMMKVMWAVIGLIGISGLLGSIPGVIGIVAVYFLYTGYKHWKKKDYTPAPEKDDPFAGFDRQWKDLENNKA
ncbi:lmo0954 family membrane protein [Bacillus sp. FSL K6-3431]|uniref:lmo0954 family membrane protein n=1 Tax=Bacillus sp. FSL K6-3431 TaxID=2921500 RepID=UPI0030F6CDC5